jgi:hypothetical protein
MTSSKELAYYHNVGQEDASKNTSRSSIFSSPDEKRAYLDGYYHALGQKDYRENKYSGFTIQGWIFSDDDDRANLDAYNAGHDAAGAIGGDTSINEISEHPPGMSIDSSSLHEWIFVFVGLLFFFRNCPAKNCTKN